jgi:non-ribosomal peptide synthetase component F
LCRSLEVTRFIVLASATAAFLHRFAGRADRDADVVLGTPVARREHPLVVDQVGLFVNTVVLRARFAAGETFTGLVHCMRGTCLDAVSHGDTPFDVIAEHLQPGNGWQRPPLFDVMVAFEEQPRVARFWGDARIKQVDVAPVENLFDLNFRFQASGEREEITLALDYRVGRFESARIELWSARFLNLLRQALRDPDGPISGIDLRAEAEKPLRRRNRVEIRL